MKEGQTVYVITSGYDANTNVHGVFANEGEAIECAEHLCSLYEWKDHTFYVQPFTLL